MTKLTETFVVKEAPDDLMRLERRLKLYIEQGIQRARAERDGVGRLNRLREMYAKIEVEAEQAARSMLNQGDKTK